MRPAVAAPTRALFAMLLIAGCSSGASHDAATATPLGEGDAVTHPAWSQDATMYEVNVRQYTAEGTFAAFGRHLARLDSLGVDIVWLMPVQPIGRKDRKGSLGSYYSIADYRATNPEFGTKADLRKVIDDAHALGMRVILDWVANHTAWDHPWVTQHPDWYTHRADGTISYPLDADGKETDWTDVADLNYDSQPMRQAMIADMKYWVDSMNVDGFRCDVAWGVPVDFWKDARAALTASKPDLFMLAEAEGPQYHAAFDATYAWEFHHLLNEIASGKQKPAVLDGYFAKQDSTYPPSAYRLAFTSNHDENSWQGTEFERMGENHAPAFILAATTAQSMPLLYTGQEDSLSKRLRFFEKDTVAWHGSGLAEFYAYAFALKHANPALWNGASGGAQARLTTGNDEVYAFSREKGENWVVVAVNFGATPAQVRFDSLPPGVAGEYTDWFTWAKDSVGAAGMRIPGHGFRVLVQGAHMDAAPQKREAGAGTNSR